MDDIEHGVEYTKSGGEERGSELGGRSLNQNGKQKNWRAEHLNQKEAIKTHKRA
jgi:hypothetical protein